MKSDKKAPATILVTSLILALIFCLPTYAQQQGPPNGAPDRGTGQGPQMGNNLEKHLSILRERLNLSDDQVVRVRNILEDHQKIAETERNRYRGNRDEAMKAAEQRRQETDEKIKAVLNGEQKKEYDKVKDKIRKEVMKNRKDGQGKPGGGRQGRRGER